MPEQEITSLPVRTCVKCGCQSPLLEAFHKSYGEQIDVQIVGQTLAGNAALIDRHHLTCAVLDDSRLKVSFAYDIDMVPSVFVANARATESSPSVPPRLGCAV